MGTSGTFEIVRTPASYIISRSGHGKWEKKGFFSFWSITQMQIFLRGIQGMPSETLRPGLSENVVVLVAIIF